MSGITRLSISTVVAICMVSAFALAGDKNGQGNSTKFGTPDEVTQGDGYTDEEKYAHHAADNEQPELTVAEEGYKKRNPSQFGRTAMIAREGNVSNLIYKLRDDIKDALVWVWTDDENPLVLGLASAGDSTAVQVTVDEYVHGYVHGPSMPFDGVVMVHKGKIVYEAYPNMRVNERHTTRSITKTVPAVLVNILEEKGLIDTDSPVEAYIPELEGTAYEGVTVKNILNMSSGVDASEFTSAAEAAIDEILDATCADAGLPPSFREWASAGTVGRVFDQGEDFNYGSFDPLVLSWLVETVTGKPFADIVHEEIWRHIGAEHDATIAVNAHGDPNATSLLSMALRDMARYGMLFTPSWSKISRERIITEKMVRKIWNEGGTPSTLCPDPLVIPTFGFDIECWYVHEYLFPYGDFPHSLGEAAHHNAWQWDVVFEDGSFYQAGSGNQGLFVSPRHDLVVAYFGNYVVGGNDMASMQWIARQLIEGEYF